MLRRLLYLLLCLALGACASAAPTGGAPSATPAAGTVTLPVPSHTPTPARPQITQAAPFPTCQPDPVPPAQFVPLPSLAAPITTTQTAALTLRSLADPHGFHIGAATDPGWLGNQEHASLLASQFNTLAAENAMKWEFIHPEPDRYDFTGGDILVNFARANNMAVYAHVLAWDLQQPRWLTEGNYSRDEWIQIFCRHIKTVVGRYRGQVYAWDVVNEPFDDQGQLNNTLWMRKIGPEYIPMAFQWAHEADPQAVLVLNEARAEGLNAKSQAVYALAWGLLQRGVPLHAVGLQMHAGLWGEPTASDLAANLRRLTALGLQVHITEMDVRTQYLSEGPGQELQIQAKMYRQVLAVCLETPGCTTFITWGLSDQESWIPGYTGRPDMPLLFDQQRQPKPAYQAVLEELSRLPLPGVTRARPVLPSSTPPAPAPAAPGFQP